MLKKVISGGQTGADRAGLIAAKSVGIRTGGFINKGYITELGNEPELKIYNLIEFGTKYPQRTLANVREADATWIFYYNKLERGSLLTKKYCDDLHKRVMTLDLMYYPDTSKGIRQYKSNEDYLVEWLNEIQPTVLNIAGNRESRSIGIQKKVADLLTAVFKSYYNIS